MQNPNTPCMRGVRLPGGVVVMGRTCEECRARFAPKEPVKPPVRHSSRKKAHA